MVECKNLSVGYGEEIVLHDVNLHFEAGKIYALVGTNGCGKSTLLRTIAGLQDKVSGEVLYDGTSADSISPRERAKKVAFLAQSRSVPNITVAKMVLHGRFPYLSYPRKYAHEDRLIARQAMQTIGIEELSDNMVQKLSGGQRQKVYIAMVLAQDTDVILLDEPSTYLDIQHQFELVSIMSRLAQQGKTIVVVLHNLNMALKYADEVVVLEKGEVVCAQSPEGVFNTNVLDRVFFIEMKKIETEFGTQYYSVPKEC